MLAGCAGAPPPAPAPLARSLPELPAWAAPVNVPEPRVGDSLRVLYARERAGREDANRRLAGVPPWYAGVRRSFEKPGVE